MPQALQKIDLDLARLRIFLKEEDLQIKNLLKEKDFLVKNLVRQAFSYLEADKKISFAKIKSAERPPGTFNTYKTLLRKSLKDANTLNNLDCVFKKY